MINENSEILKVLEQNKIYPIRDDTGRYCYFLVRPFGNILLGKTGNLADYFDRFKMNGGISKQIDDENVYLTLGQEIFRKFGAKSVTTTEFDTNEFPVEKYQPNSLGAEWSVIQIEKQNCYCLNTEEKSIIFLAPELGDLDNFNQNHIYCFTKPNQENLYIV